MHGPLREFSFPLQYYPVRWPIGPPVAYEGSVLKDENLELVKLLTPVGPGIRVLVATKVQGWGIWARIQT